MCNRFAKVFRDKRAEQRLKRDYNSKRCEKRRFFTINRNKKCLSCSHIEFIKAFSTIDKLGNAQNTN